jgi:hypothetical protein
MKKFLKKYISTIAAVLVIGSANVATTSAYACSSGFIAGGLCNLGVINNKASENLDAWHAAAGRPLDHAANEGAGAAADIVVPGSGEFITEGLELRDAVRRGESGLPLRNGGFQPQPMPQAMSMPPVRLGNVCVTNVGGYPGLFNPVGTPCQAMTPYGLAIGQVM